MLVERITPSGVLVLKSALLERAGFAHGFSTRIGGVSVAPFDALNLQSSRANAELADGERDLASNLAENRARFACAAGLATDARIAEVSQVHGNAVARTRDAILTRTFADAMTSMPGDPAALVRIADCVPILIACPSNGMVAAVHAGWRGVVAEVVLAAIDALRQEGCDISRALAAVGPCIRGAHFEIGDEVADALRNANLPACLAPTRNAQGKLHADLALAVRVQLERAGVHPANIDADPPCTFADAARFFSYRRDGARSGRLAAVIAATSLHRTPHPSLSTTDPPSSTPPHRPSTTP